MWRDDPLLAGEVPEPDRAVRFLADSGRVAEAEAAFDRIAAHPGEVGRGWDPALVLVHRALLALRLGRMPLALELAVQGWDELDADRPHRTASTHAMSMFGYLLEAVGSYESGLELLTLAVQLAREADEPDTLALCLLREANARLVRAFYIADREGLATVFTLCEEGLPLVSPGQTQRRLLNASAGALVGLGTFGEAESRAAQALESSRKSEDCYTSSYANYVFAEIRRRQDRLHDARTFADRAVTEMQRTGEIRLWSLWSRSLASICRDLDDPVGEAASLRHAVAANSTTIRVLQEGLAQTLQQHRLTRHYQSQKEAEQQAAHRDRLTGLLNRRGLEHQASTLLQQAAERTCAAWLILIDLDHFKAVNDRAGHPAGDRLLAEAARLMCRECRTDDLVCRWAGDEFVVVLLARGDDDALAVAERIRCAIGSNGWPLAIDSPPITASIGVATGAPCLETLFAAADRALYRAKRAGRDRVETDRT